MVRERKEKRRREDGRKTGNGEGGCNRRSTAGGLFTVTEGGERRDGGRWTMRGREGRLEEDE